jgi:hypothetical protein
MEHISLGSGETAAQSSNLRDGFLDNLPKPEILNWEDVSALINEFFPDPPGPPVDFDVRFQDADSPAPSTPASSVTGPTGEDFETILNRLHFTTDEAAPTEMLFRKLPLQKQATLRGVVLQAWKIENWQPEESIEDPPMITDGERTRVDEKLVEEPGFGPIKQESPDHEVPISDLAIMVDDYDDELNENWWQRYVNPDYHSEDTSGAPDTDIVVTSAVDYETDTTPAAVCIVEQQEVNLHFHHLLDAYCNTDSEAATVDPQAMAVQDRYSTMQTYPNGVNLSVPEPSHVEAGPDRYFDTAITLTPTRIGVGQRVEIYTKEQSLQAIDYQLYSKFVQKLAMENPRPVAYGYQSSNARVSQTGRAGHGTNHGGEIEGDAVDHDAMQLDEQNERAMIVTSSIADLEISAQASSAPPTDVDQKLPTPTSNPPAPRESKNQIDAPRMPKAPLAVNPDREEQDSNLDAEGETDPDTSESRVTVLRLKSNQLAVLPTTAPQAPPSNQSKIVVLTTSKSPNPKPSSTPHPPTTHRPFSLVITNALSAIRSSSDTLAAIKSSSSALAAPAPKPSGTSSGRKKRKSSQIATSASSSAPVSETRSAPASEIGSTAPADVCAAEPRKRARREPRIGECRVTPEVAREASTVTRRVTRSSSGEKKKVGK